MVKLRCEKCGYSYEVDEKKVDTSLDFMQCPNCSAITKNPFRKI